MFSLPLSPPPPQIAAADLGGKRKWKPCRIRLSIEQMRTQLLLILAAKHLLPMSCLRYIHIFNLIYVFISTVIERMLDCTLCSYPYRLSHDWRTCILVWVTHPHSTRGKYFIAKIAHACTMSSSDHCMRRVDSVFAHCILRSRHTGRDSTTRRDFLVFESQ